jgi:mannose-1-phosphate guanylyltransferase
MIRFPKKAFLLAAGHGTRLRPLTDATPKCLLPIRGIPMLQIWLEYCHRFGIKEVLINLHSHAAAVREFLDRNNTADVRVQISDEPVLLGSAGTIRANRQWVAAEETFWVFYADVLTDADLGEIVHLHEKLKAAVTIGVYRVPDPSRCGIVQLDADAWVTEFVEKPKTPIGNLAFSGVILGGPAFLDALPALSPSDIGFDVLPRLVGRMAAHEIKNYLIDIGTIENYRLAQENWLAHEVGGPKERHA